jgi:ribose transport system substrate-binding protein
MEEKSMKKLIAVAIATLMMVAIFAGCGTSAPQQSAPAATEKPAESVAPSEAASAPAESAAAGEVKEIAVLIKATDSDFWQYVLVGALNYAFENSDKVHVTTYGPPSEADTAEQAEIMDNIVTTKPDGIVVAATLSDGLNAGIEAATAAGIPVVTIDNKVTTDKYVTHYATDNLAAGAQAAQRFVDELNARGVALKGKVGLISAMAGVQVLTDREDGFVNKLKELAPDIQVLEKVFVDNDIPKSLEAAENIYSANKADLVGYFASNNATGDGLTQFITENSLGDKLVCMTFDSDPTEIDGIRSGAIVATVIQDPYGMGYKGCDTIYQIVSGAKTAADFEKYYDTGVSIVDKSNVDSEDMKGIIDPYSLKKYE